ncbi:MAG: hypothetical protein RLZZ350_2057, partial [Verrucomicrobiota bacterium]
KSEIQIIEAQPAPPEPTRSFFESALAEAKAANVDSVLAIGGGSALDIAKLIAALANSPQNIGDVFGVNLLQARALPLVCLPTTAGTGSEVSPIAVLLDEAAELKKGVVSPHLVPDAAFVDPALTFSVPAAVTAATGLDALTHCIEGYANKFAHPITDTYALRGVKLIGENLLRAVRNGHDADARAALALGSLFGGLCLGPVGTAAIHALSYPLGGKFHVAHGVSNALLAPAVLKFNLPAAPERYAQIALALGVERGANDLQTAERGIARLAELSRECGVPQHLSDFQIPHAAIPSMAKAAMQVTRLLKNNPRVVTEADAVKIYEEAF